MDLTYMTLQVVNDELQLQTGQNNSLHSDFRKKD